MTTDLLILSGVGLGFLGGVVFLLALYAYCRAVDERGRQR